MRSRYNPGRWIPLVVLCVASAAAQQGNPVCLNEFMASNGTVLADEQGQYDDWIELYNAGPTAFDLGGMFLTDDLDEPTRWRIPSDRGELTIIPAGGYVLIWADGDTDDPGLHASFKLSRDGEEIALFAADGASLVDRVVFGRQHGDVSYGRDPDGGLDWAFMTTPTPGAANAEAYVGIVKDVGFSVEHGLFTEPFTVTLTTDTPDAQIWYTLDCTAPRRNADGQFEATRYDGPIPVDGSAVIRAVAVKAGWKDSAEACRTYVFFRDAQWQVYNAATDIFSLSEDNDSSQEVVDPNFKAALEALPSVCLAIEPDDYFGRERGIAYIANKHKRGIEWERPVSVEWFDPNNTPSFQVNAGMRIHGGISRIGISSRGPAKHSLRLLFKSQYGPARLEAPLFADTDVTQFESLVLRCAFSESWAGMGRAQYVRDPFTRATMGDLGRLTPHGRPVHVYLNGFYWGAYILVERPDDGFAAAHLGGDKEDYDVLKPPSVGELIFDTMEIIAGDMEAWDALLALAEEGFADQSRYTLAQAYVDIPALIDYMLMIFYVGSTDGPLGLNVEIPRNFWAIRSRVPAGSFDFLAWDLEFCLDDLDENRVTAVGVDNPHYLFHRLATHPDFRMAVADRTYRHFFRDGVLTAQQSIERYRLLADVIERAMVAEALRWSGRTEPVYIDNQLAGWWGERDRVLETYLPARGAIVIEQLREAGFYPSLDPPRLEIDGLEQHGGAVPAGALLALVNPNAGGAVYYTTDGTDPRLFGRVAEGGAGTGQVAPSAQPYSGPIALTESRPVKARVRDDGLWSALAEAVFAVGAVAENLRITEIMYHPPEPNEEFIELANIGTETINVSMVSVTDGIDFVVPSLELAPLAVALVVRDIEAFRSRYGPDPVVAGEYGGALSNAEDRIVLRDAVGRTIQDIAYDDRWYDLTDGRGHSLICSDPFGHDPNTASDIDAWRPSVSVGGSPGRLFD